MGQVAVIGGGAAGMTAAVASAEAGDRVLLLEHTDRLGRKLLSTGNGRCNLTNRRQEPSFYHCSEPEFPVKALKRFGYRETLDFFASRGLRFKDRDGYLYPRSSQAQTIRNLLLSELSRLGVEVRTEISITEISVTEGADRKFLLKTRETSFSADRVILSCGGMAAPVTGSDGSGYRLAAELGHRIVKPLPALVPLYTEGNPLKKAAGVRTDGTVRLYIDGEKAAEENGELQLTGQGISGIPVFQVSRFAARALEEKRTVTATLDFLPEYREQDSVLDGLLTGNRDCFAALCGLFPEKLSAALLKKAGIPVHAPADRLTNRQRQTLSSTVFSYPLAITGTGDFTKAQVTAGGIDVKDVDPVTMESRLAPGLSFAGEILDVDGICGGYNLQWAWTSGFLAGKRGRL